MGARPRHRQGEKKNKKLYPPPPSTSSLFNPLPLFSHTGPPHPHYHLLIYPPASLSVPGLFTPLSYHRRYGGGFLGHYPWDSYLLALAPSTPLLAQLAAALAVVVAQCLDLSGLLWVCAIACWGGVGYVRQAWRHSFCCCFLQYSVCGIRRTISSHNTISATSSLAAAVAPVQYLQMNIFRGREGDEENEEGKKCKMSIGSSCGRPLFPPNLFHPPPTDSSYPCKFAAELQSSRPASSPACPT